MTRVNGRIRYISSQPAWEKPWVRKKGGIWAGCGQEFKMAVEQVLVCFLSLAGCLLLIEAQMCFFCYGDEFIFRTKKYDTNFVNVKIYLSTKTMAKSRNTAVLGSARTDELVVGQLLGQQCCPAEWKENLNVPEYVYEVVSRAPSNPGETVINSDV